MEAFLLWVRYWQARSERGTKAKRPGNVYVLPMLTTEQKCVFNGSDLGKEFSAKGVLEKQPKAEVLKQSKEQLNEVMQEHSAALQQEDKNEVTHHWASSQETSKQYQNCF